jgi:peroxiredoxin Q/BCP
MGREEGVVQVGQQAPNFVLPRDDGGLFELNSAGVPVVLFFYPKDSTPGCTLEARDFTKYLPEFTMFGCKVIGVSRDSTESHCKFIKRFDLKIPLLSDEQGKVCEMYGVLKAKSMFGKNYMGIERSTFLIDAHGVIRGIWQPVSISHHAEDVLTHLKKMLEQAK